MSAWPEAVWIVRKLQANFDFEQQIANYVQDLNAINGRINNLNNKIQTDELQIANTIADLNTRVVTIRDTKTNNLPSDTDSSTYGKGAIWLIIDRK